MIKLATTVVAMAFSLSGCSETIPTGDPSKTFYSELRGYETRPGVLIGQERAAYWVQSVLKGYEETEEQDLPAQLKVVPALRGCRFRKPGADELIANVHVGQSDMKTSVYGISKKKLADRANDWIQSYKRKGKEPSSQVRPSNDRLNAVDVVVTETSKPIYLVLQNDGGNILWNVHAGPGVVIAHVAVVGNGLVGVANLDKAVPVEFVGKKALKQCHVTPVRRPADHWRFVQRAKDGSSGDLSELLSENRTRHRSYSRWFNKNFGIPSETAVIGLNRASHFLVGPLPETLDQRVTFKPLKGAQVQIAPEGYVFASGNANYRSQHDQHVRARAMRLVGGDLKSLYKGS